jgi:integrase
MGTSQRAKIGLKEIAAMQPHSILWDQEVRGFCARRQFDVVTYSVVFRTRTGIQRWWKIGRHGVFTPHLARQAAKEILRDVSLGKDPGAELRALRSAPTLAELCDEYEQRANGKKASTTKSDASRIKLHIRPKLGKLKVVAVTSEQVETFMNSLTPGSAKWIIGLLGSIFSYAVKRKLCATNPVNGIDKPADRKKLRRLSDVEYAQLGAALSNVSQIAADIFKLLAISGWRSSEWRLLKWSEVDLPRQIATLSDTKTGTSIRPLSKTAIQIIEAQPRNGEFVFAYEHGRPVSNLRPHWMRLGMPSDVTPHSLRHSFASLSADMGYSDNVIAGMLGHSRNSITSRYIHLDRALIESADKVATETLRLMRH